MLDLSKAYGEICPPHPRILLWVTHCLEQLQNIFLHITYLPD